MERQDDERMPERELPEDGARETDHRASDEVVEVPEEDATLVVAEPVAIDGALVDVQADEGGYLSIMQALYNLPTRVKLVITAVFVGIALASVIGLAPIFSRPETYATINRTLDEKKGNVLALTAASTSAATAISFLPEDTGSAIADKLADLSIGFLIILTAIFLEKYLLTVIGFIVFTFVFPLCCLFFIGSLYLGRFPRNQRTCEIAWKKLIVLGIAFLLLVPASVGISDMIDSTYAESINQTIEKAEQSTEQVEAVNEAEEQQEVVVEQSEEAPAEDRTIWEQVGDWWGDVTNAAGDMVNQATNAVTGAVTGAVTWFQDILGNFIEIIAVMLVTSCVIPILVLILFFFIVKAIFNIDISKPMAMLNPHTLRTSVMGDASVADLKALAKSKTSKKSKAKDKRK